ncbi:MAG: hypothetical protein KGI50_05385 [Patescibacteria group bacterium]|nr:hypothetical protein [Patescibacteria group bacterium]MDE2438762.1 hypothetical protein [Patescibacteria group bacterium]
MKDEFLKQLLDWMQNIGNVVGEELPLFIQEAADYGFWSSLMFSIVCLFICVLSLSFFFYLLKKDKKLRYKDKKLRYPEQSPAFLYFIAAAVFIIFNICFFSEINDCIKAKFAPKLYVIERFLKD